MLKDTRAARRALIYGGLFVLGTASPRLIRFLSPRSPGDATRWDAPAPRPKAVSVEVVIAAYLEAGVINDTVSILRKQLQDSVPGASIAVIASDAETADAAQAADRVELVPRTGKPDALNHGVATSQADVVVLMDGNCRLSPDNWPQLLLSELGSADVVSAQKREEGGQEGLYWRFEKWLARGARAGDSSLAVVGEFLSLRRENYSPVPSDAILDDLWIAQDANRRGLRVTVSPSIETTEDAVSRRDQWERRVRISSGHFLQDHSTLFSYLRSRPGRDYLAHKFMRQSVGVLLFWLCMINALLALGPAAFIAGSGVVARMVREYQGVTETSRMPDPIVAVVGMQAVPVYGFVRAVRTARARHTGGSVSTGWKKVVR